MSTHHNALTCHRSKVSPLAAWLAPPFFQWCHGGMVFLFVLACVSAHMRGAEWGGGGTERRTLTSLSTPEADSSIYHASAAAHLGTISLMFAYFLFRPPGRGVGPRGVTVCAKRCITGSLGCQKVMSILSSITIQHKSWWTQSFSDGLQHKDEMKTFGTSWEWLPSCTGEYIYTFAISFFLKPSFKMIHILTLISLIACPITLHHKQIYTCFSLQCCIWVTPHLVFLKWMVDVLIANQPSLLHRQPNIHTS